MNKAHVFEILKAIGTATARMLGPSCEVVLHNAANPEKSIIWIQGKVTGRQVGGPMTSIGLRALSNGSSTEDLTNYTARSSDGRSLKCSTIFLRDEHGKIFGIFCINIDTSSFTDLRDQLDTFVTPGSELGITKSFSPKVDDLLNTLIEDGHREHGISNGQLERDARLKLIAYLEKKGFFRIRKSVPVLADRLNVSRYTLYNDLKEVRGTELKQVVLRG